MIVLQRYLKVISQEFDREKQEMKRNTSEQNNNIDDDDKKARLKFYGQQVSARLLGPEPVFRGILVSTIECLECNHISQRNEPFLDLSLPVTADKPQPPIFK